MRNTKQMKDKNNLPENHCHVSSLSMNIDKLAKTWSRNIRTNLQDLPKGYKWGFSEEDRLVAH